MQAGAMFLFAVSGYAAAKDDDGPMSFAAFLGVVASIGALVLAFCMGAVK
jgi:hypothetical protein